MGGGERAPGRTARAHVGPEACRNRQAMLMDRLTVLRGGDCSLERGAELLAEHRPRSLSAQMTKLKFIFRY
jgi:hypothetical protein